MCYFRNGNGNRNRNRNTRSISIPPDAEPEILDRGSDGRNTVHLLTLDVAGENVAVWLREVKESSHGRDASREYKGLRIPSAISCLG